MNNRNANDTIKGYYYQFDCSIKTILSLTSNTDSIIVEGIEDIDVETATDEVAIQCKYHSQTAYNHSVIAKPIRMMLSHFSSIKKYNSIYIKYHLHGHYKSGHEKLNRYVNNQQIVDIHFLKEKLLTYTEDGFQKKHYELLDLNDSDLKIFLELLSVNIYAENQSQQQQKIIDLLKDHFSCDQFASEHYYYSNALSEIIKISSNRKIEDRRISKGKFLKRINHKNALFNKWFIHIKGQESYAKEIKKKYFRRGLNQRDNERFFLIEVSNTDNIQNLKDLVFKVSERYSNLKMLERNTYCPYIYFHLLIPPILIELKNQLYSEDFDFIDGFPFLGCNFSVKHINQKACSQNKISIKFIDELSQLSEILASNSKTKEVYQFYREKPFFLAEDADFKEINIPVKQLEIIKEMI